MNLTEALIPIFTYLLPILFFLYMGLDVLLRNTKSSEHRLVSVMIGLYFLLFLEEFIRYQLPIAYSGVLAAKWFGSVGILIPGIGVHVLSKFARLDRRMPKYIYPYVFYIPVIVVLINLFSKERIISTALFNQVGVWKMPILDKPYFITITVSLVVSALFLLMIARGKSNASTVERKAIYNVLSRGASLVLIWTALTGYLDFGDALPPYPYIYAGLIWCFALRLAMIKFDFLNFIDKKYEKLFNLNPAAILLLDQHGRMKEVNPSAKQLFQLMKLKHVTFYDLVGEAAKDHIQSRKAISDFETTICTEEKRIDVLIDGDYVWVDNEPHVILIIRDITAQKENQQVITFMAYHDPLTLLPNRRFFYEKLEEAIQDARVRQQQLALIIVDLDLFKETNDTYGHKVGDEILQHAARLINESAAQQGVAARFGGDEFVFFLNEISSVEFVRDKLNQLQQTFIQDVFMHEGAAIPIGLSLGVSFFPSDGDDVDTLLNSADKAMYEVKRKGRTTGRT
ncbi:sensor domain-containing diguanylate cyclase [Paenibacillus sp. HWE-109]|uniref:sensor domain-containing diguanylate cyclase n=1 Tax=Paenibacillus sp. HWE-109 TaxID=1306526 RepID=UPI001EDCAB10|nr:sensor domain-containing diguanylate cyclase [Paenibacillus sp. HWE-109]UKS25931.1 sensor domain-containing diguanylate cyclase [Paenibacillus sp. HWE-109]